MAKRAKKTSKKTTGSAKTGKARKSASGKKTAATAKPVKKAAKAAKVTKKTPRKTAAKATKPAKRVALKKAPAASAAQRVIEPTAKPAAAAIAPAAPAQAKPASVAAPANTVTASSAQASTASAKPKPTTQQEIAHAFAINTARLLHDDKCTDVVLLDVRSKSGITDYIVIGSGTSDRQMHSVLGHVAEEATKASIPVWRRDTDQGSLWLLLDCVDVVVHLFEPNTRAHYDLEMLWGDAPRLEWERPDQQTRDRAGLHV